ncbi:MAG: flagellar hook-basal body complex protein [Alphaproteobacteria bacterium]|nr:flagellar hook-basal body complex protein [Alphaproteobacteria bacterium]MCB9974105.1 flagellar hook-basal body complex protein [Rhodospirillales bacterium]
MGLFGALFTGVSALSAQSQKTAIISNNIANVNTTGFKRSEASFFSLVTTATNTSRYSPGTVTVNRIQRVSQQGPISQSESSTDASVSGKGFFAVKRDSLDSSLTEFLYTRNGQFSEDSQGLLRNSAGFFLYGWPLDVNGDLPANQGDLDSLVPIDVAFLGGLTRPTTTAELAVNLDAAEVDSQFSTLLTASPDFTRGLTVYDTLGNGQNLSFEFTKTYGPQATAFSSLTNLTAATSLVTNLALTDGDRFTVNDGTTTITLEINDGGAVGVGATGVETIGDIINAINAGLADATAFLGNNGEIVIQNNEFTAGTETVTIAESVGTPLAELGFTPGVYTSDDIGTSGNYSNGTFADSPPYSTGEFPTLQFLPGDPLYNPRGWWQVRILDPNSNTLTVGLINYNGDGTLNALPDNQGNIDIELTNVNWGNGSELQSIDINISSFSQFSSDYTVLFSDQNGAELGLRTGVEIDREGFVIAQFSNGATSRLYKLPLVTFSNPNGLREVSGTAYTETEDSGEENLREAGTGGAGFLEPSTLENSNVDLADEFAQLIVAQRAYSAGTKVINTVDQMTQELLQLR